MPGSLDANLLGSLDLGATVDEPSCGGPYTSARLATVHERSCGDQVEHSLTFC
jgi:hypothetical protein